MVCLATSTTRWISIEDAVHPPVRRCVPGTDPDAEWKQLAKVVTQREAAARASLSPFPVRDALPASSRACTHVRLLARCSLGVLPTSPGHAPLRARALGWRVAN